MTMKGVFNMNDTNIRLVRHKSKLARKKKVAAYARVSTGKDAMLHSLSAQVSYYSNLIQNTRGWLYAGVYMDEAITGTNSERPNFQKMLDEARLGHIDMIITKSISRFARNTVTLLETIRELKSLNVDVYFEEQNIHSISADGELMLSFLASYAQEESRSASENLKWSIRNRFKKGMAWNTQVYGYQFSSGTFIKIPEEAEIVRHIFASYLNGKGTPAIAKDLNSRGILTKLNKSWRHGAVAYVLRNYLYTGNTILQSTYKDNFINKRKVINDGVLPKYHVEKSHEAIIDSETFDKVQSKILEKQKSRKSNDQPHEPTLYRGLLICEHCGKNYGRRITKDKAYWICSTYNMHGKNKCPSKQIPEEVLNETVSKVMNLKKVSIEELNHKVKKIVVLDGQQLTIQPKQGDPITSLWKHKSRRESWTVDMKEKARQRAVKGKIDNEKNNSHPTND